MRISKERYDIRAARLAKESKAAKEAAEKLAHKPGLAAKLGKKIPGIGLFVTLYFWKSDVEAKGPEGGTANSVLDAIPWVGLGKGIIELFTGDWIPDKGAASCPGTSLVPSVLPYDDARHEFIKPSSVPGAKPPTFLSPTLAPFRMKPWRP